MPTPASAPNKRRKRVLAIDDEPAMTEWLKMVIEADGYEVRTAQSGPPDTVTPPGENTQRDRFRYRLRLGLRGTLADDWFFGLRLETSANSRSTNVTIGDEASGGPFIPLHLETFRHTQEVTRADALDVFASRSYVAALPEQDRNALLERVAEQLPKTELVEIPYITELYWTRKST